MTNKIIFSKKCLEYGGFHIESPKRIEQSFNLLKNKGYEFLEPELASEKDILLVHQTNYLNDIKKGKSEDSDTPAYKDIYQYASLAAGGAITAAKNQGFSLMRPPGHHAGKKGKALGALTRGFCYFNNLAIAVKYLGKKTLILDIDGHHGNGTEEIFAGDKKVIFISLHRFPFYPGTGLKSKENCFNVPLEAECGDECYLKAFKKSLEQVNFEEIEVVAVSAGFDGYSGDLASLGLTNRTFLEIGKILKNIKKHTFFVLEGGYDSLNIVNGIDSLFGKKSK